MSPLDQVLAEGWPDGTFGGPRPPATRYRPCVSPDDQARHRADLIAALTGQAWDQPIPARRTRKASR